MKTPFLAVCLIALFNISPLTSCTDKSDLTENVTLLGDKSIVTRTDDDPTLHFYDNGLPDGDPYLEYGCATPAINCFAAVVVTGPKKDFVDDIFDNIGSWSVNELRDYIEENIDLSNEVIGETPTSGIISGTYGFYVRGNAEMDYRYLVTRYGSSIISATEIEN